MDKTIVWARSNKKICIGIVNIEDTSQKNEYGNEYARGYYKKK